MKKIIVPTARDITQHEKKILDKPEIRVWCHPERIGKSGSDYWMTFDNVQEAKKFIQNHKEAEDTPLFAFNGFEYNLLETKIIEVAETQTQGGQK